MRTFGERTIFFFFFGSMFESTNKVASDNPSPRRQKDSLRGKIIEKKPHGPSVTLWDRQVKKIPPPPPLFGLKKKNQKIKKSNSIPTISLSEKKTRPYKKREKKKCYLITSFLTPFFFLSGSLLSRAHLCITYISKLRL